MWFGDISGQLRKWQEEARKRRQADAPDRALRLAPENVAHWTNILRKAAARVTTGTRTCDYTPWLKAITEAQGRIAPLDLARDPYAHRMVATDFRNFMEDCALPAWPEPRRDLIEFALTVLESDVMLFRSGYAKRHLAARLAQSPLTPTDAQRIEVVLKRSVERGTGLEEYRGYCKLAGRLVLKGLVPDLPGWLAPRAEGAILTLGMADGRLWNEILRQDLSDADLKALSSGGWVRPYRNGVAWPALGVVVPAGDVVNTREQQVKRNAWRMLDHILRRCPSVAGEILP